jgi:hypothetical protein
MRTEAGVTCTEIREKMYNHIRDPPIQRRSVVFVRVFSGKACSILLYYVIRIIQLPSVVSTSTPYGYIKVHCSRGPT